MKGADERGGGERRGIDTLRELEMPRALVETGGATATARRIGLSRPAASRAIAQREARSGRQLFDRTGGRHLGAALVARRFAPAIPDSASSRLPASRPCPAAAANFMAMAHAGPGTGEPPVQRNPA